MRWRIRLRMHPGPGFASFAELWCRWSRHAAIGHGRRARPGLRLRHRLCAPTTDYAVRLGRGQWLRRAYARMEDQVLVMAAQRTGKSGIIADRILDHPGPVLATSTRADLFDITAGARALRGPVHVFNPQGVGGVPSSLAWDLLGPCQDLVMARRMAIWLKVPGIGGDLQWFQAKGDVALAACCGPPRCPAARSWTCTRGCSCTATRRACRSWPSTRAAPGRCSRWSSGCSRRTGRRAASGTRST